MKEIWFLTCIAVAVWLAVLDVPDPIILGDPLNRSAEPSARAQAEGSRRSLKLALFFLGLVPMWLFGQRSEDPQFRRRRRRYGWWW